MSATPQPGARLAVGEDAAVSLILPGSWIRIPLEDEEASNREISRAIKQQVPRRDENAPVRHELREMMRDIAAMARANGAVLLALSLELLPGLPFSAAIVADYVAAPELDDDVPIAYRLAAVMPDGELLGLDIGPVARTIEQVEPADPESGLPTQSRLRYLVPSPDPARWLEIVVNVPTGPDIDLVTALYDMVVNTLHWAGTPRAEAGAGIPSSFDGSDLRWGVLPIPGSEGPA